MVKTSEMIEELTKIMKLFGDCDVFVNGDEDDVRITELFYDNTASNPEWHGVFVATDEWPNRTHEEDWDL